MSEDSRIRSAGRTEVELRERVSFLASHIGKRLRTVFAHHMLKTGLRGEVAGFITLEDFLIDLYECYPRQALKYFTGRQGFDRLMADAVRKQGAQMPRESTRLPMDQFAAFDPVLRRVVHRAVKIATASRSGTAEIGHFAAALGSEDDALRSLKEKWGIVIKGKSANE